MIRLENYRNISPALASASAFSYWQTQGLIASNSSNSSQVVYVMASKTDRELNLLLPVKCTHIHMHVLTHTCKHSKLKQVENHRKDSNWLGLGHMYIRKLMNCDQKEKEL